MSNNTSRTWRPTKGREIQDITDKINETSNNTNTITKVISIGSSGGGSTISAVNSFNGRNGVVIPQSGDYKANIINTDITNFNGNLSSADTTVQKALDTLDNLGWNLDGGNPNSIYLASQVLDGGTA